MRMCWTCSPTGQTSSLARSHSCFLRSSVCILRNSSGTVRLSLRPVVSWPPDAPCLQVTASVQINIELYSSFYRLHCWPLCFIFEISMISCLFKLVASMLSDYEWHGAWWMFLSLELYIVYSTPPRSVSLCEAAAPLQNHVSGPTTKMPRLPEWQIPYKKRNLNKYKFKSSKTCFWSDFETKTKSQKTSPPSPRS